MYCSSCGEELDDSVQFCSSCGESVQDRASKSKQEVDHPKQDVDKSKQNVDHSDSPSGGGHFDFKSGLYGILGGIVLIIVAALWYGSTQYIYPTQAAIAMWMFILGIGIFVLPPLWYWIVNPIRHRI
ncbi:zinc-ribbon domain-containing protein [Haloarcula sp. CGMCC 1.6347]|uniref:zinc-ribbon domain-containing protein n=1 Tax=Haloarcula sp. CGMCC 1.6347 TaxID=3111455 RepID=UPI003FA54A22